MECREALGDDLNAPLIRGRDAQQIQITEEDVG